MENQNQVDVQILDTTNETERDLLNREFDTIQQSLSLAKEGFSIVNNCLDVYRESQQIKRNIANIQSETSVKLANIAAKYSLCHDMLIETFKERGEALQKHYDVLSSAMECGDRDLVISALNGISSIVVENPIENFTKLMEEWNDKSKPLELDF